MEKALKTAAGWIAVAVLAGAWGYYELIHKPEQQASKRSISKAETAKRVSEWAYVAKEKSIAPGETLRLVVIPHSSGLDIVDLKCFVYTNQEFRKAQFLCPDAKQLDIEAPE